MAEANEILKDHIKEKKLDIHVLPPDTTSEETRARLTNKLSKYEKMRIINRKYDMDKMVENYSNLSKAINILVEKLGGKNDWNKLNVHGQHVDHFHYFPFVAILNNKRYYTERSERVKNDIILEHPADLVKQIMLISSLFMHRYLLSNMDETQMNYLQNIRAMSPFMLHYDINGAANIRNSEN